VKAIIYLRVSTDEQADSGLGLDAQLSAATQKAVQIGATKIVTFTDAGVSGSKPIAKRPGLSNALAAIQKGDVLIVAKRDRLSRSLPIAIAIEELLKARKATLLSANGEGTGENDDSVSSLMQSRMFQVFSEIERQMIRERTRSALAVKRSRGECVGTVPYGFRLSSDGTHLEADQHEQQVVSIIQAMRTAGETFEAIIEHLNDQGFRNRRGHVWQYRSVWNIAHAAFSAHGRSLAVC
jgi:site-specific DNA recombinase